jgi:hypothetical protein
MWILAPPMTERELISPDGRIGRATIGREGLPGKKIRADRRVRRQEIAMTRCRRAASGLVFSRLQDGSDPSVVFDPNQFAQSGAMA